jgi:hypothetical protein
MCKITLTRVDAPYAGVRQILRHQALLDEGENKMMPPDQWPDLSAISLEDRYALMRFVAARNWSRSCDILEERPSLLAPWAVTFLWEFVADVVLSEEDFDIFCAHLFVLEMAQKQGVKQTRAFLKRFPDPL